MVEEDREAKFQASFKEYVSAVKGLLCSNQISNEKLTAIVQQLEIVGTNFPLELSRIFIEKLKEILSFNHKQTLYKSF